MSLNFFFAFTMLITTNLCIAQGKKDIKKNKIKSITELITVTDNNKTNSYKEQYTAFNKNGEIIEEIEFNKDGSIKKKATVKYDSNDNKTEETFFIPADLKQKKNCKIIYKYNANNDKMEENEFDSNTGKLIRKQVCSYNGKGERVTEETYDANNKLVKKNIYSYDSRGLKIEKKTFNKNNILESTKKYIYEF